MDAADILRHMPAISTAYACDIYGVCQRYLWYMPCIMMTVGHNEKSKRPQGTVGVSAVVDTDPGGVARGGDLAIQGQENTEDRGRCLSLRM